jgi:hypothetical protein
MSRGLPRFVLSNDCNARSVRTRCSPRTGSERTKHAAPFTTRASHSVQGVRAAIADSLDACSRQQPRGMMRRLHSSQPPKSQQVA